MNQENGVYMEYFIWEILRALTFGNFVKWHKRWWQKVKKLWKLHFDCSTQRKSYRPIHNDIYTCAICVKSSIKRSQKKDINICTWPPQILWSVTVSLQTWAHSDVSQISYKRAGWLKSAQSSDCLMQTFVFSQAASVENMWKLSAPHSMCENSFETPLVTAWREQLLL